MTTKIKSTSLEDNIITTSHLHTNFSVDSDKIATNAIGPSELDLTASYAFTGTVTGAGSMVKLLNASSVSGATYDISSTYINATYDRYKIYYYIKPVTDNTTVRIRFFIGGSIYDSQGYSHETSSINGDTQTNEASDNIRINYDGSGNGDGEGNSGWIELQNVNNTSFPTCLTGLNNNYKNATHSLGYFSGALVRGQKASAVNGLRFYMSSGDIAAGKIQVYGITD